MSINNIILGSHNHLPLSTSEAALESAYVSCYKPFISSLYKYSQIPMVLHYSGVLLAWIDSRHPEFTIILGELVNRKQVEILGGGFYEPIFPLIPLVDRIGQIELMTTYIRKRFGKRPRGCWIPGFVWEQNLTSTLHTAGMDYTFLESDQFQAAGLSEAEIMQPRLTEDQGKIITVFPVARQLTQKVLYDDATGLVDYLLKASQKPSANTIVVFPELYTNPTTGSSQAESRFEAFFASLMDAIPIEAFALPSRLLKRDRAYEKTYFSSSSEWLSQPQTGLESSTKGLTGGQPAIGIASPRYGLTRFPEANALYARMLHTHLRINQIRGDKYRKKSSREELWKAQGYELYWPGNFKVIRNNDLRKSYYRSIIQAEKTAREKAVFLPSVLSGDFDLDGEKDYIIQGTKLNCYIKTRGAAIFELDCLVKNWNYLDTFTEQPLLFSNSKACAFADYFLASDLKLEDLFKNQIAQSVYCGDDLYETLEVDKSRLCLVFKRSPVDGQGLFPGLEIIKRIWLKKSLLSVQYALLNRGESPEQLIFCPEINLALADGESEIQSNQSTRSTRQRTRVLELSELKNLEELIIYDKANQITLKLRSSSACDFWIIPYKSNHSPASKDLGCYQHTGIWPIHRLSLAPGDSWEILLTLRIGR